MNHADIVAKIRWKVVGTGGIEPPTPSVSGKCSPAELRAFGYEYWIERNKQPKAVTKFLKGGNGLRYWVVSQFESRSRPSASSTIHSALRNTERPSRKKNPEKTSC